MAKDREIACTFLLPARSLSSPPPLPPLPQIIPLPDVHLHPRGPADEFLVLACDGVWDVFSNDEMAVFVERHANAAREGGRKVRREGREGGMVCGTCFLMTRWLSLWKDTQMRRGREGGRYGGRGGRELGVGRVQKIKIANAKAHLT
jgi:hypothetical protein